MKTLKYFLLSLTLVLALAVTGFGQSATTQTTLNGAITSTTGTTFVVASVTGFSASTQTQEYDLFVDGEFMKVQAVNTTAVSVTVTRAIRGTRATTHPTGALVWFGVAGSLGPFVNQTPYPGSACTATQYTRLPLVNWQSGEISYCTGSVWNSWGTNRQSIDRVPYTGVADTAYTAKLTDYIIAYTSLSAARTVTLPAATGLIGKVIIIRNESTIASNTIWVTSTSNIDTIASGKGIYGTSTAAALGTNGGLAAVGIGRFYSNGSAWFSW